MKFTPIVTATTSRSPVTQKDHVLVVLPSANGPTEFTSISTYDDLVNNFGTQFRLPKVGSGLDKDDEEYSVLLLNSLKYILSDGIPILCTSVTSAVNAAIRIYYVPELDQPWNVCSIAHKSDAFCETLAENFSNFFHSDVIVGSDPHYTLVHELPLNRKADDLGQQIETSADRDADSSIIGRFITLPMMNLANPSATITPYLIMLEDNRLEVGSHNDDIFSVASPIQDGGKSLVMTCHGTNEEIRNEVDRVNAILATLNSADETYLTKWRCVFDESKNRILFISNHFIYQSGMYSLWSNEDFVSETNASGIITDTLTKDYAVLDIESKLTGSIGNDFKVEFTTTDKGNFVRVYQNVNIAELIQLWDSDTGWEYSSDSDLINIKQYVNEYYPEISMIFKDEFFVNKRIELTGGYDDENLTYSQIAEKALEYVDYEDDYPINFIFDAMATHLDYHHKVIQNLDRFKNKNILILTNGDLYDKIDSATSSNKCIYYNRVPVLTTQNEEVSLASILMSSMHQYDFIPYTSIIVSPTYEDSIKALRGTEVITPEVDGTKIYIDEIRIANTDIEYTIDRVLSSMVFNEFNILFDNMVGEIYPKNSDLEKEANYLLTNMTVAPNLITSYTVDGLTRVGNEVTIILQVNRIEISGGTRKLYININL